MHTRFVECDMAIFSDSSQEKFNSAGLLDSLLVRFTFFDKIRSVSVEDMDILGIDINYSRFLSATKQERENISTHYEKIALGT
jgi:hypothetical protein